MHVEPLIRRAARSIESLAPAMVGLERDAQELDDVRKAVKRGYFTPEEDERLHAWFARYLTARAALREVVDELRPIARGRIRASEGDRLRSFVAAYAGACMLVHAGRFLVELGAEPVVRRKLNEAEPRFRIPRKQFTRIYRSVTAKRNALRLLRAMRHADAHRDEIELLGDDPVMRPIVEALRAAEPSVRIGLRRYAKARLRYRWYALRRRGVSASEQSMFAVCEMSGRVIAEARPPWRPHGVSAATIGAIRDLLRPGDVMVTRHHRALSNLFLPGYWPHAALFVGHAEHKATLGIGDDHPRGCNWIGPLCVLEARKDGVLFRALEDTLSVDAVAVIRPTLERQQLATAIARAIEHEGKLYNFDFDFFRADRLVCTEVVYRAYEGVGAIELPLIRRAGRLTLSAEDLLAAALDRRGFEAVAVFGTPASRRALVTGADAEQAIRASMQP